MTKYYIHILTVFALLTLQSLTSYSRGATHGNSIKNPINLGTYSHNFAVQVKNNSINYSNNYGSTANEIYYTFKIEKSMDIIIHNWGSDINSSILYLIDTKFLEYPEAAFLKREVGSWGVSDKEKKQLREKYKLAGKIEGSSMGSEDKDNNYDRNILIDGKRGLAYLKYDHLPAGEYCIISEGGNKHHNGNIQITLVGEIAVKDRINPKQEGDYYENPILIGEQDDYFRFKDTRNTKSYPSGAISRYLESDQYNYSSRVYYSLKTKSTMNISIHHQGSEIAKTIIDLIKFKNDRKGEYAIGADGKPEFVSGNKYFELIKSQSDFTKHLPMGAPHKANLYAVNVPPGSYLIVCGGDEYLGNNTELQRRGLRGVLTTTVEGYKIEGVTSDNPKEIGEVKKSFVYRDSVSIDRYNTTIGDGSKRKVVFHKLKLMRPMNITIAHAGSDFEDTEIFLNGSNGRTYSNDLIRNFLAIDSLPAGEYFVESRGKCPDSTLGDSEIIHIRIEGKIFPLPGENQDMAIDVGKHNAPFDFSEIYNTGYYDNNYSGTPQSDVFHRFELTRTMDVTIWHYSPFFNNTAVYLFDNSFEKIADYKQNPSSEHTNKRGHANLRTKLNPGVYYVVSEGISKDGNIRLSISGKIRGYVYQNPTSFQLNKDKNYILSINPTRELTSVEGVNVEDAIYEVSYYDGLGRFEEKIHRGVSPKKKDIIIYQEYNMFGRDEKTWLPIALPSTGSFVSLDDVKKQSVFQYLGDTSVYSKLIYESSVLDNILEEYGPGQEWHANGKSVKTRLLTNDSTHPCKRLIARDNIVTNSGYYDDGELYVVERKDEDNNVSYEFKDKLGQVVLTRQMEKETRHDTYYVFDNIGNLRFVLPPIMADLLTQNESYTNEDDAIKKYAFVYHYDHRNRNIMKRIPGCAPIYMVYDKADRLILSQDGVQRTKNEWAFNKYDAFGRLILSGVYTDTLSHQTLQDQYKDIVVKESAPHGDYGYTSNSRPIVTPDKVLLVNYYDNYEHLLNQETSFRNNLNYEDKEGYGKRYVNESCLECSAKGLLVGTRVKMLDGSGEIVTAMYYDDKGRIVQQKSTNHLGGYEREYYAYTFTGLPVKKYLEHDVSYGLFVEEYRYEYDHAERLTKTFHRLNGGNEVLLADLHYDELGRVKSKSFLNNRGKTTYTYNIRSWLTGIDNSFFKQTLQYEEGGLYNGNIASNRSNNKHLNTRDDYFVYTYDGLNRLKSSWYAVSHGNVYGENFTYDKHGNITSLVRRGLKNPYPVTASEIGIVNDLNITYDGNQMQKVKNAADIYHFYKSPYFYDNADEATEYLYDANGSMTADLNKQISKIEYNSLNLPKSAQFRSGNMINYSYDASGVKRRVESLTSREQMNIPMGTLNPLTALQVAYKEEVNYSSNIIYGEYNEVIRVLLPDGYIQYERGNSAGGWVYYSQIKDHLGSVRADVSMYGPVDYTSYYASGMEMVRRDFGLRSPYRYNGKEFQKMHGLNQYDCHARSFDPAIPRFTTIDPLAEKYYSVSPYAYCGNNPVNRIDPTGMDWEDINGNKIEDHSNLQVYIFYDPKSFDSQSRQMYKDAVAKYGEGSVAMSNVTTTAEFKQDWGDMAGGNIQEINLNYHGSPQTINLDYETNQYLTSTGTGKTPMGNPATNISNLPTPSGNVWDAQLKINSCRSNDVASIPNGSSTIAQSFRDNTSFRSIRTTDKNVSYFYYFSPNRPHPQDDSSWKFLYRPVQQQYSGVGLPPK